MFKTDRAGGEAGSRKEKWGKGIGRQRVSELDFGRQVRKLRRGKGDRDRVSVLARSSL